MTVNRLCQVTVVVGGRRRRFASMDEAVGSFRFRVVGRRAAMLAGRALVVFVKELFFV